MNTEFITFKNQSWQFTSAFFQYCLQHTFDDPSARVHSSRFLATGGKLVVDAKYETLSTSRIIGIQQYELVYEREGQNFERKVLIKSKQPVQDLMKVISKLISDYGLDSRVASHEYLAPAGGFEKSDIKEIEIYRLQIRHSALKNYQPELLGLYVDQAKQDYIIVMEGLDEAYLSTNTDLSLWDREAVEATIDAIAELHAIWYRKTESLAQQVWMSPEMTTTRMESLLPLWRGLADAARSQVGKIMTMEDLEFHLDLVGTMSHWWKKIEHLPKTMIHNDLVPKNVGFRQGEVKKCVCVFDWDAAIVHLPQRDLCEFLCYFISENSSADEVLPFIERHRLTLEKYSNQKIDPVDWGQGFGLSLKDFFINRLAMEILIEELEPRNVAKVYRTARNLMDLFPGD
ncbi:MAG: phosphotransferase [Nitrospirota bacterium]|nr:MAG: phosphotransferase [Nitrospirota bacterium]